MYWHKRLWNRIIKNIEIDKFVAINISYEEIKKFTFDELFDFKILNDCFGCEWGGIINSGQVYCNNCLFAVDTNPYCLNGCWMLYTGAETKEEAIVYAKVIRNFPGKKKYLKNKK